jgi:hypothetical protein
MKNKSRSRPSKKIKKASPNVIKLLKGGGCSAPDIVSQYISPPNSGIPAGYDGVQSIFQRIFYTPGAAQTNLLTTTPSPQRGGGFMIDPARTIDKVAFVQPYPPRAEPVILDGKVFLSQGCESQCGAGKISSYNVKKMTQRKSKSQDKKRSQRKSLSVKRSRSVKRSQHKVARKQKKNSRHNKRAQNGGNEGEKGNFSPDMMTREFDGKQPTWNVNTI